MSRPVASADSSQSRPSLSRVSETTLGSLMSVEAIEQIRQLLEKTLQEDGEEPGGRVISFALAYAWEDLDAPDGEESSWLATMRSGRTHDAVGMLEVAKQQMIDNYLEDD